MKKILLVLFVTSFLFTGIYANEFSVSCDTSDMTIEKKWYEGGTLHKAKVADWKKATDRNKLATCADFMAVVDNTVTMTELKKRAIKLKKCIDETIDGLENADQQSISLIAAMCTKAMGYR